MSLRSIRVTRSTSAWRCSGPPLTNIANQVAPVDLQRPSSHASWTATSRAPGAMGAGPTKSVPLRFAYTCIRDRPDDTQPWG